MATQPCVMAIGAHPDDVEFGMAGTLLLLRRAGCRLHVMSLADGSCGSSVMDGATTARVRAAESREAAKILDATWHPPLAVDLGIFYEKELLARLASLVRQIAPDIMLLPSPLDYMEDHTNTCRLAVTAAFSRGMPNYPVTPPQAALDQPVVLYHAQPHGHHDGLNRFQRPDFVIAIDDVIEIKTAALAAHQSQQAWLDASQTMSQYLITMQQLSRRMGEVAGGSCTFGEGWRRHNHLGFCEPESRPLETLLAANYLPLDISAAIVSNMVT